MRPRDAVIEGAYRYSLSRCWNLHRETPRVCFIMLNPSTADALNDDPTITRCLDFAVRWGCRSLEVVNLFAHRATNPKELARQVDPVGHRNDEYIMAAIKRANLIVAAWGASGGKLLAPRVVEVKKLLRKGGKLVHCLGETGDGHPRHPLMLAKLTPLAVFKLTSREL